MKPEPLNDEFFGIIPAKGPQPGPTVGSAVRITAAVVLLLGLLVVLWVTFSVSLILLVGIGYSVWARYRRRPEPGLRVFAIAGVGGLLVPVAFQVAGLGDRLNVVAVLDLLLVYPILLGSGSAWLAASWPRAIERRATGPDRLVLGVLVVLGAIFAVVVLGLMIYGFLIGDTNDILD